MRGADAGTSIFGRYGARRAAVAAMFVAAVSLIAATSARATWVQPGAGPVNSPATTQGQPDLAQIGSSVYQVSIEVSGSSRAVVVRRLSAGDTTWRRVGTDLNYGYDTGATAARIANVAGVPYVAWQEQDQSTGVAQVYVKRLTALPPPDAWEPVGTSLNLDASRAAIDPSIAAVGGVAYAALSQGTSSNRQIRLLRLGSGGWSAVGPALNVSAAGDGYAPRVLDRGGVAIVTWDEVAAGVRDAHASSLNSGGGGFTALGGNLTRPQGASKGCRLAVWNGSLAAGCLIDEAGVDRFYVKQYNETSGAWDQLGGAVNVTAGDAANISLVAIGGNLYTLHREVLNGRKRFVLCRYDAATASWLVLPELVGENESDLAALADVAGVPWVAESESLGAGVVLELAPSVADFDVTASTDGARAAMYFEDYGLPYARAATAAGSNDLLDGAIAGTPPALTAAFTGLTPDSAYEARISATDPFGRSFVVGETGFFTERVDTAFDHDQPEVTLAYAAKTVRPPRIHGTANDLGSGVARVEVAVGVHRGPDCVWLVLAALTPGECDATRWMRASGTTSFNLALGGALRRRLARSAYEVYARAVDAAGNVSEVVAYRCTKYATPRRRRAGARRGRAISECVEWR